MGKHGLTCIFWANLTPFSLQVAAVFRVIFGHALQLLCLLVFLFGLEHDAGQVRRTPPAPCGNGMELSVLGGVSNRAHFKPYHA